MIDAVEPDRAGGGGMGGDDKRDPHISELDLRRPSSRAMAAFGALMIIAIIATNATQAFLSHADAARSIDESARSRLNVGLGRLAHAPIEAESELIEAALPGDEAAPLQARLRAAMRGSEWLERVVYLDAGGRERFRLQKPGDDTTEPAFEDMAESVAAGEVENYRNRIEYRRSYSPSVIREEQVQFVDGLMQRAGENGFTFPVPFMVVGIAGVSPVLEDALDRGTLVAEIDLLPVVSELNFASPAIRSVLVDPSGTVVAVSELAGNPLAYDPGDRFTQGAPVFEGGGERNAEAVTFSAASQGFQLIAIYPRDELYSSLVGMDRRAALVSLIGVVGSVLVLYVLGRWIFA